LFNLLKKINSMHTGGFKLETISAETFEQMRAHYRALVLDVLGLKIEQTADAQELLQVVLSFYKEAKEAKDYAKVDVIRAQLKGQGIVIKDMKTGIDWAYEE
jgi:cysteinyl-tRNA synthetase